MSGAANSRTCLSCRKKGEKGDLLKLAVGPGGVVIDYNEKLPGRGAYLCPELKCIKEGLRDDFLSRAFKKKTKAPEYGNFIEELESKIRRKIGSLLGMGRKSGGISLGFDAAVESAGRSADGLMIVASDLSENTGRKVIENIRDAGARLITYSTKDALGEVLGASPVGVVFVSGAGLAGALEKEIIRLTNISGG